MAMFVFFASTASTAPPKPVQPACALTEADKAANAELSWEDFDQRGTLPSTWRKLDEAGCRQQAIEALLDYTIKGPVADPYQQRIMLFHLGQSLAFSGDERRAASYIGLSREPKGSRPPENTLNWNDYVTGTWAFLVKDRSLLIRSRDAVIASPGNGNKRNGLILAGLETCFDKPYSSAYSPSCRK